MVQSLGLVEEEWVCNTLYIQLKSHMWKNEIVEKIQGRGQVMLE